MRLDKYLYILLYSGHINKGGMRISIGIPLHVLEVTEIISNTLTLKRIELPVICHTHNTPTSFCISHKNRWNTRVHPELFSWILICLLWTCLTMLNTTPTYLFLDLWHIKPRLYCLAKWYLKLTTLKSVF